MKSYHVWKLEREFNENTSFQKWHEETLSEATTSSRYSVEVNYRTKIAETVDAFAKICLGYVSAALKQNGYHIKQVYEQKPIRILVSTRNWDDGEWVGILLWNPDKNCFVMGRGFYNRDVKTVSIQHSKVAKGDSAQELVKELRNLMHQLKSEPDRHVEKLKGINLKRGPK